MTQKRRHYKKRLRNKSSPETLLISKKYRTSDLENVSDKSDHDSLNDTEHIDSDSAADQSILSDIRSVVEPKMDSFGNSAILNQSGAEAVPDPDATLMQSQSILQDGSNAPPFMNMNPGMMQPQGSPAPMNPMNPMNLLPHQIHQLMNMQAHMQQPIVMPQQGLSDEDILRVATRLKQLLKDDIDELIEQRVVLKITPLENEVECLKKTVSQLENELKKVTVRNDDLEQYSRRSCLRISGIAETEHEDTTQIVLDVARRCGAKIGIDDIDRSHRVGPGKAADGQETDDFGDISDEPRRSRKNREIIVKFRSHGARLQLLRGRAFFRDKNEKVYINEDLCKTRKNLAFVARQLKKNEKSTVTRTWVYNGNVFVQDNEDKKVRITSSEDLDPYKPPDEHGVA